MDALSKNDIIELNITDMTADGEGIGKYNGFPFFVKDAIIGDVISAKVVKLKKTYGYARVESVLTPSPDRVTPHCSIARQCGGCQIQAMDYKAQLAFKEKMVRNNLSRIGGIEPDTYAFLPIVGMDNPYEYRNKAQFPVAKDKNGNIVMGFYAGRTHSVIGCERCHIGDRVNEPVLAAVRDYMTVCTIPPYNEIDTSGTVRHILIRVGKKTGEVMVCLVINADTLPDTSYIVEKLCDSVPGIASVMININKEKTNVILGPVSKTIWGKSYIEDFIGDIRYRISPNSFYQVNPIQTEKLYTKALSLAELTGNETVWDLYCGIGTISLFLAKKARKVYGVEIVPQAIEDARQNALLNGIDNATFFAGKAEEVVPAYYDEHRDEHADVMVVDPPRKGCDEKLLATMISMSPERIVYVSCDSATLSRDLKFLTSNGYDVRQVQCFDQFPHTCHVETVACLQRVDM